MTLPQRPIPILLVWVALALLAIPGAAASLDPGFVLSSDGTLSSHGPDPTMTPGAVPGLEAAPLNPAFLQYQEARDMTNGEMLLSAVVPENETLRPCTGLLPSPATLVWSEDAAALTADPPAESYFNLADEGRLTPVKDQGKCGACWTFASLGSLESALLTDGLGEWNLSENNLKNTHGFDWGPCDGGNAFMATAYLARWSGPVNESDDPYLLPVPSSDSPTGLSPVMQVQNVTFLPPRAGPLDNDLIKTTIKNDGGLYAGFLVNYTCFGPNATTYYLPENSTVKLDGGHGVLLVGWDDAYPSANFVEAPPGDGAFIAKNSWGTSIGDDGYLYLSYYDRSIGRFYDQTTAYIGDDEATVLFTGDPVGTYDHLYQHDPLGWTDSIGTGTSTTIYGRNVFTAERYEDLHAVSFYTREPGTEYEVNVHLMQGSMSLLGYTVNGTMALPGYHTLPFETPVPLVPGQEFSVTLRVTAPTDTHPLVVEKSVEGYSSNATAHPGESFVSLDGVEWADLTDFISDTNLCIKGITRDPLRVPDDYATIQEAVDAALPGQMVLIEDGTYLENVVVDHSLTLAGTPDAVIDGGGMTALTLAADNITVWGISLTNGGDGVQVTGENTTLMDLNVAGCSGDGIALEGAVRTSILRAQVRDSGQSGIVVNETDWTGIFHSDLLANGDDGIAVSGSTRVLCSGVNATENGRDGIALDSVDAMMVQNCTATGNGGTGLDLYMVRYGEVSGNTMAENRWNLCFVPVPGYEETVAVDETNTVDGKPVYVWSNRHDAAVPADAGMAYLIRCQHITAEDLTLAGNYVGLVVFNSTDVSVENVTATRNYAGAYCMGSDGLSVNASAFVGNDYSGLSSLNCTATTVTGSVIADNQVGAFVAAASQGDTVLWHNTFANNTAGHLSLQGEVALNSTVPVSYRYDGAYYTHVLGNFWDDYAGTDTDGDGIGETAYSIGGLNDTSPLIESADHYQVGFVPPTPTPTPKPRPAPPHHRVHYVSSSSPSPAPLHEASYRTEGQAAIFEVDLTAQDAALAGVRVTVEETALPAGVVPPATAVYEYDEVTLSDAAGPALRVADLNFAVPLEWIEAQGARTDDIVLFRYHDDTWTPLKTTCVKEENRTAYYAAETPGFSYFAIAVAEDVPGPAAAGATPTPAVPIPSQATPVAGFIPCLAAALAALLIRKR
ncbi:lectin like domain-containing protein [Methanofollis sp. W23]|uniref:lectin like domain-containing protein n=1 Tax=Methanofollis sp. W23 TaxID=2817849 RepID=UPI001AEAB0E8|nr:lectin like domain-containing protein [Methanofollis sp. W23]